jgi:hypothetical protein
MQNYFKHKFNPFDKEHLKTYRKFLQTRNWATGCPFQLEWPYENVPVMIEKKIIEAYLDDIIRTSSFKKKSA